ncbi:GAD-like domain-containing protein [Paraburkholderia guartelaensis]|uniref:GAD-like domain-containing protein n=1 Tax=Paraburkholderia guartelaensis TaxID=2546446 RepID=UPI002AB65B39|nr:GAD-like domain-containing protein [Paraburkholderia guartelaensis]
MTDELFDAFIQKFGRGKTRQQVPESALSRYRGVLPDRLLKIWREEGWSSYGDGLVWIVDPQAYEGIVDMWLRDTPVAGIDKYHVIARTAFGDLFLWGEATGPKITLSCLLHTLVFLPGKVEQRVENADRALGIFFATLSRAGCDKDNLFKRALKHLGPLGPEDMYGFEPALIAGGEMSLDHLRKVDLDVHLSILRQLGAPQAGAF